MFINYRLYLNLVILEQDAKCSFQNGTSSQFNQ